MNVHGYELTKDWSNSNIGKTAQASKGGKLYFLKQYGEYKMPRHDESTSPRLYDKLKSEFDSFMENRIAINKALASLAGPGGNIILPTDWFVDDIFYIEATEFVPNLIEDEMILNLSREELLFVMLTAAGSLYNIHRKNIIHSDLKRTNILAARNSAGKIVAKFIDFDRSYFANDIRPDELGGDQSYMSPELAQCFMYDMADEALAYLSVQSDIFSLGLVFHNYLTKGAFPKITHLSGPLKARMDDGQTVYCCEALLAGGHLEISSKIKDEYLERLLIAMLQPEPTDRPTAQEVLNVLKMKTVLEVKADSVVTVEGKTASSSSRSGDKTKPADPEPVKPVKGYCSPWADHAITFDEAKLAASGYVASEQITQNGVKCYKLYKSDGTGRVFTAQILTVLGYTASGEKVGASPAKAGATGASAPVKYETDDGKLWESESDYEFDIAALNAGGFKSVVRATKNGKDGYLLTKTNDEQRFMVFGQLKLLGFVVKK